MGWTYIGDPNPTNTGDRTLCRPCNKGTRSPPQTVAVREPVVRAAPTPQHDRLESAPVTIAHTTGSLVLAEYDATRFPVRAPSVYKGLGLSDDVFKGSGVHISKTPELAERLSKLGASVRLHPDVAAGLGAIADQLENAGKEASERIVQVREQLATLGEALYTYQEEGVAWLSGVLGGAILADEPGCGKSVQALMAARVDAPIIIVCPASVKSVWVKEIAKFRPDLTPWVHSGRNSFMHWPLPNWAMIINYEILPAAPITIAKSVKKGKASKLLPFPAGCPKGTVLILDEAHYAKADDTARSFSTEELASIVRSNGGVVFALTGTPIMNHPGDMMRLLEVIGSLPDTFGSKRGFNEAFGAKTVYTNYGAEVVWGSPTEEALSTISRVMLRREKKNVLQFLPTKRWEDITVVVEAPTAAADRLGEIFTAEEIERYSEHGGGGKEWSDHIMAARRELAEAKIPAMLEHAKWHEECDDPVVIFSAHRSPIQELQKRDGWRVIFGDTPVAERTEAIEMFQAGKLKGIGATIQAGGVGITLTRGCNVIFVDRAWTPAGNEQAEDRVCRIGQTRGVLITCLVADHEVDEAVARCLSRKRKIIDDSVKASVNMPENTEAARIRALLERTR